MAVTRLEVRSRVPYEAGEAFGDAGAYERLDGTLHFAVDPAHPLNEGIVDLDKAPRDAAGLVRFAADFCLLQPVEPARGNGRLLFEVPNRGRRGVLGTFNRAAPPPAPAERIDPGDGFLLRRGRTGRPGGRADRPRRPERGAGRRAARALALRPRRGRPARARRHLRLARGRLRAGAHLRAGVPHAHLPGGRRGAAGGARLRLV